MRLARTTQELCRHSCELVGASVLPSHTQLVFGDGKTPPLCHFLSNCSGVLLQVLRMPLSRYEGRVSTQVCHASAAPAMALTLPDMMHVSELLSARILSNLG